MGRIRLFHRLTLAAVLAGAVGNLAMGQDFDILDFDSTAPGPWSDVALTTLTVPQVADGSIDLDGTLTPSQYGGFQGVTVTPGDNAWILDFPDDRSWDNAEDSSFTFYLAHDTDNFYVGVQVKDDVVNSDDPNSAFWKDDAIEIVTDVFNDRYDINTDVSNDPVGGHNYVNFEGRFSAWNDETNERDLARWSTQVDWTYGEDPEDDIFGKGGEVEGGWEMEVRFAKSVFEIELEDPERVSKIEEGTVMGFNIGLDDDDKQGIGPNGSGERTEDLELQYFWANRERYLNWNEAESDFYTEAEIAESLAALREGRFEGALADFLDTGINSAGRLAHGGTGEIIFGGFGIVDLPGDANGDGEVNRDDLVVACATGLRDEVIAALGLLEGDFDADKKVGFSDFLVLSANFNKTVEAYTDGDIDCSGDVRFPDFLVLSTNFNKTSAGATASVPEPAGLTLLGFAGLLLCSVWRRRLG